jgi:hypothetical protein
MKHPATSKQPGFFASSLKLHVNGPVVGCGQAGFLEGFGVGRVGV